MARAQAVAKTTNSDLNVQSAPVTDADMSGIDEREDKAGRLKQLLMPIAARLSYGVYQRYFEIIRADTPELREEVYRLRYQVYVVEHGFEKAEDFPDKIERDEYDGRSLHVLLCHRQSGTRLGTARLVRPNYAEPTKSFPIQNASDNPVINDPEVSLYAAELSRLAISKDRMKECNRARGLFGWATLDPTIRTNRARVALSRLLLPYLSVGLIAGVIELAAEKGYPILYAIMEPFLIKNMGRIGITFPIVGEAVEYHGLRHPTVLPSIADTFGEMKKIDRAAWEIITNRGRTQDLALDAEIGDEAARQAVVRAFHLANIPVPIQLTTSTDATKSKKRLVGEAGKTHAA